MKETANTFKKIVIFVLVIGGLGFGAFVYLTREPSVEDELLIATPTSTAGSNEIVQALNELKKIELSTEGVIDNRTFNSLIDHTTILAPQTPGRLNPFAPLTGVSVFQVENN